MAKKRHRQEEWEEPEVEKTPDVATCPDCQSDNLDSFNSSHRCWEGGREARKSFVNYQCLDCGKTWVEEA